jgi:ribonucleoside-diphosphate reductase alpha chain
MSRNETYLDLNASLNLYGEDGKLQLGKDREAVRRYFLEHVNQNTVFFHSLEEKLDYLVEEGYYEQAVLDRYSFDFIKSLYKRAYGVKFRFSSFMGAYKYYRGYTLKTFDGQRYLERYEDRVCIVALELAQGDEALAISAVDEMISRRYQPATPTFLNCGKVARGEKVSCFLLRIEDNMESIARSLNAALQLSKRGGGVAFNLTNLREVGAPIKRIENQASGIIPVMKMFEDAFSYANQLGARQGAGAIYLNAHHPDIMRMLDTKRENADEKIRIKTLSMGIMVPDITFELARANRDMYLFSPYDIERVYGKAMSDISITEMYQELVDNPEITKTKIDPRAFFRTIAELQFESGYPYIIFEDTVNKSNPIQGRINMSNLCSEILQVNTPSLYNADLGYKETGKDISCNLGSMNIAEAMASPDLGKTVETSIRLLTAVSDMSDLESVPSIDNGNKLSHAIGLGQMNLHGYLAANFIHYGSEEGLDFTNIYFYTVAYHAIHASNLLARERKTTFDNFENSTYASGEYFTKYIDQVGQPKTARVSALFEAAGIHIPTCEDWALLRDRVMLYGMYNSNLQAVPPTGSISYINNSTASIHPVAAAIEKRKEGKLGLVYYPAPMLSDENLEYYQDAYEIGPDKIIDTYAEATQHVDQGLSMTLFFKDTATTRDINMAQIRAWRKGIKSIYYIRIRQNALEGTEMEGCVSCTL